MMQFGNDMMIGNLQVYFEQSHIISSNTMMQKLYDKLLDNGNLKIYC